MHSSLQWIPAREVMPEALRDPGTYTQVMDRVQIFSCVDLVDPL